MYRYIAVIILSMVLAGCDCTRYTYGYVADYETKQILKGVEVKSFAALDGRVKDERITYTDSSGWFETAFAINGVAKCGVLKLIVSEGGYHTAYETNMVAGDTIFLFRKKE